MTTICPICGKEIIGTGTYWDARTIRDGEVVYERCVHGVEKAGRGHVIYENNYVSDVLNREKKKIKADLALAKKEIEHLKNKVKGVEDRKGLSYWTAEKEKNTNRLRQLCAILKTSYGEDM
jgi:cytochrome c biogenesis protein ResB